MPCGITGDYIEQMLMSAEVKSKKNFQFTCPILFPESNLDEPEVKGDQEEVKGGTQGG